jgi:hypothetical protein
MRRIGRPGRQDAPGASSCSLPFEPVLAYRLPDQRRATLRTISSAPCSTPARPVPAPFSSGSKTGQITSQLHTRQPGRCLSDFGQIISPDSPSASGTTAFGNGGNHHAISLAGRKGRSK